MLGSHNHNRPFIPDGPCLGLRVIASARRMEALVDLKALGMDTVLLDVTDTAAITAAKEQVHSLTGGKLDILVNNACVLSDILKQMVRC